MPTLDKFPHGQGEQASQGGRDGHLQGKKGVGDGQAEAAPEFYGPLITIQNGTRAVSNVVVTDVTEAPEG